MTTPNTDTDGLRPGQTAELFSFDHDLANFVSVGTGTVSEDGRVVKSDPGVGVLKAGWHGAGNPPPPDGSAEPAFLTLVPSVKFARPGDRIEFTAFGGPSDDVESYSWRLVAEEAGDNPSVFTMLAEPACPQQASCTGAVSSQSPAQATLVAQIRTRSGDTTERRSRVATPRILIQRIWSDQFPNEPVANFLPNGAGASADALIHVLMGARSTGKLHGKAKISVTPDTDFVRSKIRVQFGNGSFEPQGSGALDGSDPSIAIFSTSGATDVLTIVAGADTDGTPGLSSSEVLERPQNLKFRTVASTGYGLAIAETTAFRAAFTLFGQAGQFLGRFLAGVNPTGSTEAPGTMGIPSTDPLALEHHVGLRFTSPSEATLPKLVFGRTSSLSQTIRENEKFRMEVLSRVTSARPAIEAFFLIPGNATQTYRLTTVRTRSTVFYENSGPIPDALFLTFGKAAIEIAVTADIVKIASNPSRFRIEQASVDGIHIDLYDWDHDIDSNQARVQAGHRTLGSAGSVFLSEVDLTGGVPLLHGTVF